MQAWLVCWLIFVKTSLAKEEVTGFWSFFQCFCQHKGFKQILTIVVILRSFELNPYLMSLETTKSSQYQWKSICSVREEYTCAF